MARVGSTNDERRVHVHVVAGKVKGDEPLEDDGPTGEGGGEKNEEARGSAAIGDHVENGAEAGRLLTDTGGVAIEGVEQTRDAVEERAGARVEWHVVEGCEGEDDSGVP